MHDPAFVHTVWPKSSPGMGFILKCPFFQDTESRNWAKISWQAGIVIANSCSCGGFWLTFQTFWLWAMGLRQNPHIEPCQKKARDTANPNSLPWWLESLWVSGFWKASCRERMHPQNSTTLLAPAQSLDIHMALSFSGNPSELPLFCSEIPKHPPLIPFSEATYLTHTVSLGKKGNQYTITNKIKEWEKEREGLRKVLGVLP